MTRSERLQPLLKVKQQHQDEAARQLAAQEQALDQAIAQQARVVDASRERSDIERTRLLLASRETHVLEKLSASYRADEVRADEQRTQRELDDLGGRRRANGGEDPAP